MALKDDQPLSELLKPPSAKKPGKGHRYSSGGVQISERQALAEERERSLKALRKFKKFRS